MQPKKIKVKNIQGDKKNSLILVPKISYAEIYLGDSISKYTSGVEYIFLARKNKNDFDEYLFPKQEFSCWCKSDIIVSIHIEGSCFLNNNQLIGMHIGDFIKLVNKNPNGEIDKLYTKRNSMIQYVYDFDILGLQVWVSKMRIITLIASKKFRNYEAL